MKHCKYILVILFFISGSISAQTYKDRKEIYQVVIKDFGDNKFPIVNETIDRIENYDIDGNMDRWLKQFRIQKNSDTSRLVELMVSFPCVNPIEYSESVIGFLKRKNIEQINFSDQTNNKKLDSLSNYILDKRLIPWKKAPNTNSAIGNIFKKKNAISLSRIVFDKQNNIALVKRWMYSKNKKSKNPSKIIILQKMGMDWNVIGSLEQKMATNNLSVSSNKL